MLSGPPLPLNVRLEQEPTRNQLIPLYMFLSMSHHHLPGSLADDAVILGPFLSDDDDDTIGRARSAKNRTSTLSPSTQQTTRTTSWCSSSSPSGTAAVSPTISKSVSAEAHPSSLLRVRPLSKQEDRHSQSSSRRCCQANLRQGHEGTLKPPVPRGVTRVASKYESPGRQPLPRRRSLSTEEEIRTIGCFNLRQQQHVSTKSKVKQADKPSWLQICDPCHRILERSVTPDLSSDLVVLRRLNSDFGQPVLVGEKTLELDLSDFRFIDSSAGDLHHNWRQDASEGEARRRLSNVVAEKSTVTKENRNGGREFVNNNKWEYLCKSENSSGGGGALDAEDEDVANNNLGEEERVKAATDRQKRRVCQQSAFADQVVAEKKQHQLADNGKCSAEKDYSDSKDKAVNQSVGDSFEEDYERCIESINRQLKLESRDAALRSRRASDRGDQVTLQGANNTRRSVEDDVYEEEKEVCGLQCVCLAPSRGGSYGINKKSAGGE